MEKMCNFILNERSKGQHDFFMQCFFLVAASWSEGLSNCSSSDEQFIVHDNCIDAIAKQWTHPFAGGRLTPVPNIAKTHSHQDSMTKTMAVHDIRGMDT